jgi:hypothetical protein
MPLYFFDFDDDGRKPGTPDTIGTDLPSLASVSEEAVAVLANIAKDRLPDGHNRVFSARVRKEEDLVIFTASLTLKSGWA